MTNQPLWFLDHKDAWKRWHTLPEEAKIALEQRLIAYHAQVLHDRERFYQLNPQIKDPSK